MMVKSNRQYYLELKENGWIDTKCEILLSDARSTGLDDASIDIIITSPPYVTSYEYADIHQLTGYWFNYFSDITTFRKNFIGTFYSNNQSLNSRSEIAKKIISNLQPKDKRISCEVANYFMDMYDVAVEMKRILKSQGITCLVIGNTSMKGIEINSAEVFAEYLVDLDFTLVDVIKRKIPHKLIPTIRDKHTGRFTKLNNKDSQLVYPDEFIIIARKN